MRGFLFVVVLAAVLGSPSCTGSAFKFTVRNDTNETVAVMECSGTVVDDAQCDQLGRARIIAPGESATLIGGDTDGRLYHTSWVLVESEAGLTLGCVYKRVNNPDGRIVLLVSEVQACPD